MENNIKAILYTKITYNFAVIWFHDYDITYSHYVDSALFYIL